MALTTEQEVKCKFCGSTNHKKHHAQERMFGSGEKFWYLECDSCGSLQIDDVPDNLSDFYSGDYYSFTDLVYSSGFRQFLKRIRMKTFLASGGKFFEPSYGYWLKKVKPKLTDAIADIGCGAGQLLYEFYAGGYQNLHGFDPFIKETKVISKELTIWKKGIEESDLKFDLIMMHHSFEHMEDPDHILKLCFEKLNPGGKLLIRTPVTDSQVWKEEGVYWVQLDAPRHLIIPSTEGMAISAKKQGFNLGEIEFDSTGFQFWGTEIYKKGLPLNPELVQGIFSQKEMAQFNENALRLNQEGKGDQVCFYLSKPF